jgi:hypothetical protein
MFEQDKNKYYFLIRKKKLKKIKKPYFRKLNQGQHRGPSSPENRQ